MSEISVTVEDGSDAGTVAERLRAAGVRVDKVLSSIGVVTGSVAQDRKPEIARIEGVAAVEEQNTFRLPPPDADVQ